LKTPTGCFVRPTGLHAGLSNRIDNLLLRALDEEPGARFAVLDEFLKELACEIGSDQLWQAMEIEEKETFGLVGVGDSLPGLFEVGYTGESASASPPGPVLVSAPEAEGVLAAAPWGAVAGIAADSEGAADHRKEFGAASWVAEADAASALGIAPDRGEALAAASGVTEAGIAAASEMLPGPGPRAPGHVPTYRGQFSWWCTALLVLATLILFVLARFELDSSGQQNHWAQYQEWDTIFRGLEQHGTAGPAAGP